ncbi:hypothetical protein N8198_02745 [Gammaproteobacteria bacterium]|nr:hypothetical protein [Gammaproteobacteria bacterium]
MANTEHEELVSEEELARAENYVDKQFKHTLSRWNKKDDYYARLLKTRWYESLEEETGGPGKHRSYCVAPFKVHKTAVNRICEDFPGRIKANDPVFKSLTGDDRKNWHDAQQRLRDTMRQAPVLHRHLARIIRWQNIVFAAGQNDSRDGTGLEKLGATNEKNTQFLDVLWTRLQAIFLLHSRLSVPGDTDDSTPVADESDRDEEQSESNE